MKIEQLIPLEDELNALLTSQQAHNRAQEYYKSLFRAAVSGMGPAVRNRINSINNHMLILRVMEKHGKPVSFFEKRRLERVAKIMGGNLTLQATQPPLWVHKAVKRINPVTGYREIVSVPTNELNGHGIINIRKRIRQNLFESKIEYPDANVYSDMGNGDWK